MQPGAGVFVAADMHYLASGAARAAAVVAADVAFCHLVADRVRLVPDVEPCQPGQFCLRELPPLRALPGGLTGMAPCWWPAATPTWQMSVFPSTATMHIYASLTTARHVEHALAVRREGCKRVAFRSRSRRLYWINPFDAVTWRRAEQHFLAALWGRPHGVAHRGARRLNDELAEPARHAGPI